MRSPTCRSERSANGSNSSAPSPPAHRRSRTTRTGHGRGLHGDRRVTRRAVQPHAQRGGGGMSDNEEGVNSRSEWLRRRRQSAGQQEEASESSEPSQPDETGEPSEMSKPSKPSETKNIKEVWESRYLYVEPELNDEIEADRTDRTHPSRPGNQVASPSITPKTTFHTTTTPLL